MECESDVKDVICDFCKSSQNDEMRLGRKYVYKKYKVHYFCLLFSAEAYQTEEDSKGILGFMPNIIAKVQRKSLKRVCCYCQENGASLVCCEKKCKKVFHLPCGIKAFCITQYYGQFETFCDKHSPQQTYTDEDRQYTLQTSKWESLCGMCYEMVMPEVNYHSLWAPCCRNGWFHRDCVLKLAHSAGYYFFKCPLCNNKDKFLEEMQRMGIYVPQQDAAWEQDSNAYHELYMRYDRCDAEMCFCPFGREHGGGSDSEWSLQLCDLCGSSGIHKSCLPESNSVILSQKRYRCDFCLKANQKLNEKELGMSYHLSENSSLRINKRFDSEIEKDHAYARKTQKLTETDDSNSSSSIIVDDSPEDNIHNMEANNVSSNVLNSLKHSEVNKTHFSNTNEIVDQDIDVRKGSLTSALTQNENSDVNTLSIHTIIPSLQNEGSTINSSVRDSIINIMTTAEIHNVTPLQCERKNISKEIQDYQPSTGKTMLGAEENCNIYEEMDASDYQNRFKLIENKSNAVLSNERHPISKLSYKNSPNLSMANKKKSNLSPLIAPSLKRKAFTKLFNLEMNPTKKTSHDTPNDIIINESTDEIEVTGSPDLIPNISPDTFKHKSVQINKKKTVNSAEVNTNSFNRDIVEVLGNHPTDRQKSRFTTEHWLKQRKIVAPNKQIYRDISRKNVKDTYNIPMWKQKMIETRDLLQLNDNDVEDEQKTGAAEELSLRMEDRICETQVSKENVVGNRIETCVDDKTNKFSSVEKRAISDATDSGTRKVCIEMQHAVPSTSKSERIPAYKKILENRTNCKTNVNHEKSKVNNTEISNKKSNSELLNTDRNVDMNKKLHDTIEFMEFANNNIIHSTQHSDIDQEFKIIAANSKGTLEKQEENLKKFRQDNKVNKVKSALKSLQKESGTDLKIKNKHQERISQYNFKADVRCNLAINLLNGTQQPENKKVEGALNMFRKAKENYMEGKKRLMQARCEHNKLKAAVEFARKVFYEELLEEKYRAYLENENSTK